MFWLRALGPALAAFRDPNRADMVAKVGELTGLKALEHIRNKMLLNQTGRKILRERPLINSSAIDLEKLSLLPVSSFGYNYSKFLHEHNFSPDQRAPILYIQDAELCYVMTRYRQVHDFWHVLSGLPISVEAEIGLKVFEYFQTGLPMNALAALVGPLSLSLEQRKNFFDLYLPWALNCSSSSKFLMNEMYEDYLEHDIQQVRSILGISPIMTAALPE